MDRLIDHAAGLAAPQSIRPCRRLQYLSDRGRCLRPGRVRDDALCRIESRSRFRALLNLGLTGYRVFHRDPHKYTYWDYQPAGGNATKGCVSTISVVAAGADRIVGCDIDKSPRGKERASDHTPIWCELAA